LRLTVDSGQWGNVRSVVSSSQLSRWISCCASVPLGLILIWGSGEKLDHWVHGSSILRAPVTRVVARPAARTARTAYRTAPARGRTATGISALAREMTAAPRVRGAAVQALESAAPSLVRRPHAGLGAAPHPIRGALCKASSRSSCFSIDNNVSLFGKCLGCCEF
jgi:hypothetical protein